MRAGRSSWSCRRVDAAIGIEIPGGAGWGAGGRGAGGGGAHSDGRASSHEVGQPCRPGPHRIRTHPRDHGGRVRRVVALLRRSALGAAQPRGGGRVARFSREPYRLERQPLRCAGAPESPDSSPGASLLLPNHRSHDHLPSGISGCRRPVLAITSVWRAPSSGESIHARSLRHLALQSFRSAHG
jgi:hypothetical protein